MTSQDPNYQSMGIPAPTISTEAQTTASQSDQSSTADAARDKVEVIRDTAETARDTAREQVGRVTDEVQHQARDLAGEARAVLRDQAEAQTARLADTLQQMARELTSMADSAERQDGIPAELARNAARALGRAVTTIDRRGATGSIEEIKRYARSHPGTYVMGAFLLGVAGGRLARNIGSEATPDTSAMRPVSSTGSQPSPAYAHSTTTPGTSGTTAAETVQAPSYDQGAYGEGAYPQATQGSYDAGQTGPSGYPR